MQCRMCGHEWTTPPDACPQCQPAPPPVVASPPVATTVPPPPLLAPGVTPAGLPVDLGASYQVKFGNWMGYEAFGYVGNGTLSLGGSQMLVAGKKHWPVIKRVGMFLLITFAPLIFGVLIGPVLALILVHYICLSPATDYIDTGTIVTVKRNRRELTLITRDARGKRRQHRFSAGNEAEAAQIEATLSSSLAHV